MIKSQEKPKKIHFIGIGGIGVSALARYYLARGAQVSGSDVAESEIIEELRRLGAKIPPSPPFAKGGAGGITVSVYAHRGIGIRTDRICEMMQPSP